MITLKIGRHEYDITPDDEFLDNGACVQLMTQSNEKGAWGHTPHPVLSKKAVKEISVFKRKQKKHRYATDVELFSLTA